MLITLGGRALQAYPALCGHFSENELNELNRMENKFLTASILEEWLSVVL
jgi:hypothetical protein